MSKPHDTQVTTAACTTWRKSVTTVTAPGLMLEYVTDGDQVRPGALCSVWGSSSAIVCRTPVRPSAQWCTVCLPRSVGSQRHSHSSPGLVGSTGVNCAHVNGASTNRSIWVERNVGAGLLIALKLELKRKGAFSSCETLCMLTHQPPSCGRPSSPRCHPRLPSWG